MTILEASITKRLAEESILEILREFTQETGLTITTVDVVIAEYIHGPNQPVKFTITAIL